MQEIRCGGCGRKLAVGVFTRLQIKCPRCGLMNDMRAISSPQPERPGAPQTKGGHGTQPARGSAL